MSVKDWEESLRTTREMIIKSTPPKKMRAFCNSLVLKPTRVCRSLHACALCGLEITDGQSYKDGGYGRRAHLVCMEATSAELKRKGV